MTEDCIAQIVSNDYADFLVQYTIDITRLQEQYQTECIHEISSRFAVVHIPVSRITNRSIYEFTYAAFPSLYTTVDTSSLEASGIFRVQTLPNFALRGQGILVGIVDTGIDYTHRAFRNADNTTRIHSIWDQSIQSGNYPEGFYYGTEYSREQINEALSSEEPLSIVPSTDENGHGTFLAGVAAGSTDEENDFTGVVPDAEFVVVKLKEAKPYLKSFFQVPEDALCYQENDIMHGVKYLYEMARSLGRPIAICIGLGSNQGGHDGRGALSTYISTISDQVGVSVVVASGNEGNAGHHYFGTIDRAIGSDTVELRVGENETGFTMEVWGYAPNTYSIDILSPTGEYIPRIPARLGESREINFIFERTTIFVDYSIIESETGDQLILLRFRDPTPGTWRFQVYGRGDLIHSFHCWLPITGFISPDTYFIESNPDTTITSPGNAYVPLTVTAYNHRTGSIYINSSRGFTRTNIAKPDIAAPGVDIQGPVFNNEYGIRSGSSLAAAQATGVAAMLLEWGILRQNLRIMDGYEVKNYLIRGARRTPGQLYPNTQWGYGILDIYNTFISLRGEIQEP
ncbi:subtilase family protein [Mobilisporobacter senegalensis]|uniref:Subtilase family protein n=1 Tax=Mobilisporobacter senegalensis TaxID=1329262 RepID=A0A3N1XFQ5_9FIRM|nr:S8 family peptidase [Mobilisporobacter senegalensis]ROR23647.1 subtilase family protein [Mobilisporobacter senegalensis]